jgi:hypothetical protein
LFDPFQVGLGRPRLDDVCGLQDLHQCFRLLFTKLSRLVVCRLQWWKQKLSRSFCVGIPPEKLHSARRAGQNSPLPRERSLLPRRRIRRCLKPSHGVVNHTTGEPLVIGSRKEIWGFCQALERLCIRYWSGRLARRRIFSHLRSIDRYSRGTGLSGIGNVALSCTSPWSEVQYFPSFVVSPPPSRPSQPKERNPASLSLL